jgi:uncharacterized protein
VDIDALTAAGLFVGGLLAGALNAVAGGSSFITFPLLLAAGLPPLLANTTNFVALSPANAVRSSPIAPRSAASATCCPGRW